VALRVGVGVETVPRNAAKAEPGLAVAIALELGLVGEHATPATIYEGARSFTPAKGE